MHNICLVTSEYNGPFKNGGIGTAFRYLADLLVQQGYNVTVLYTAQVDIDDDAMAHWKAVLAQDGIRFVPFIQGLRQSLLYVPTDDGALGFHVYQWLKAEVFDAIHFHDYQGLGYHSLQAKRQGLAFGRTTLCVQVHGPSAWSYPNNLVYVNDITTIATFFQERESIALADVVISPSQHMLDWCKGQGWKLPKQVVHLPNLYAGNAADNPVNKCQVVDEIVFFGRLETRKGLEVFCRALQRIPRKLLAGKTITFLGKAGFIGNTPSETAIAQWCEGLEYKILSDYDQKTAIAYLKQEGKVAVIPSFCENAPYTVLECAMEYIPFIATAVGGVPEMIKPQYHEQCLCAPDVNALAETLTQALTDGAVRPESSIDVEEVKARWLALHTTLLAKSSSDPEPSISISGLPLVSVGLIHYNRPHYLKHAIASIEAQAYPKLEVILVDDGSSDAEAIAYLDAITPMFDAKGWRIIRQKNAYLGAARNTAARHAKGEYLKFMDDDNIAKLHEISCFVDVALKTGADVLTCCLEIFKGEGLPEEGIGKEVWVPAGVDPALGVLVNSFGDANALIKKTVFDALGGFTEIHGVGHEDWEFFGKALLAGYKFELIPEDLFYYRIAPGSMQQLTHKVRNHLRNIRPYVERYPELSSLFYFSQGLFAENYALKEEQTRMQHEMAELQAVLQQSRKDYNALLDSTSWRVTAPMRKVMSSVNGLRQRAVANDLCDDAT